ncbi:CFEM domain containing protein [Metarhizium album ARSEF 1941]|uniref:CFEM domain containing protein n=1 Tax=Metarhizium album (strain ARSEF 1941) TaxID=1081103 RepID=A0A0B2X062_METAS|nr:CFEM domain containing protein [Metarhizium album ARSEF 1941]KHO01912.1 CFEM domain containing protein [Metarhizium album ARSEF 1941]
MKSTVFSLALIAAVAAQDSASGLGCGKVCIDNMLKKGSALGCSDGDWSCLCKNPDFHNGLRDCSTQSCPNEANQVIKFSTDECARVGVKVTGGGAGAGGASQSGGNGGEASKTGEGDGGAKVTTIYSTETGPDGKAVTTPVATSTIGAGNGEAGGAGGVLTFTTNGSQVVSTLATAMSSSSGTESAGASETGSGSESSTGGAGSESSTGGSGSESTSEGNGGASQTSEGGSGSQTSGNGGATSTSKGFAAQITAAPGILAAAGLAALLI